MSYQYSMEWKELLPIYGIKADQIVFPLWGLDDGVLLDILHIMYVHETNNNVFYMKRKYMQTCGFLPRKTYSQNYILTLQLIAGGRIHCKGFFDTE